MPLTSQQLNRIMSKSGQAFVPKNKMNYAGRVCETFLRKKLYRFEDRAALAAYNLLKQTNMLIREYALQTAAQLRLTTIGNNADSIAFRRMVSSYTVARLQEYGEQVARQAYQYATMAYAAGWYGRLWMLDQATHHDKRVKIARLPRNKIAQAVLQPSLREAVSADMSAYEYIGNEWRDGYMTAVAASTIKVKRVINATTQTPVSALGLTQAISTTLGVNATPKEASSGLYHATTLPTRAAVMRSANHASADVYTTHTELLLGAMWLTSHDSKVCPTCARQDGRIFIINSLVGAALFGLPPDGSHYGCRCTIIPLLIPYDVADTPPDDPFDDWLLEYGFMDELDYFMQDNVLESTQL